jgi:TIR domain
MPSKYEPETRAEVVRLVLDHRGDYPSEWAAIMAVSNRLEIGAVCASSGGLVAAPCTVFMFAVERRGQMDSLEYDVFLSYARADDVEGWVSGLRDAVYDDFREFSSEPFRIFFDTTEIRGRQDWELRLRQGLRSSRVLLVCLSPSYLRSTYCHWEWPATAITGRLTGGRYDLAEAGRRLVYPVQQRLDLPPLTPWPPPPSPQPNTAPPPTPTTAKSSATWPPASTR